MGESAGSDVSSSCSPKNSKTASASNVDTFPLDTTSLSNGISHCMALVLSEMLRYRPPLFLQLLAPGSYAMKLGMQPAIPTSVQNTRMHAVASLSA